MARVPLLFVRQGRRKAPGLFLTVKPREGPGLMAGWAMLDTGSEVSVFPAALLRSRRFPLDRAKELPGGLVGIGGTTRLFFLERIVAACRDDDGAFHPLNLPRLFFVDANVPPIVGRDLLRMFNSRLHADFQEETGAIDIG